MKNNRNFNFIATTLIIFSIHNIAQAQTETEKLPFECVGCNLSGINAGVTTYLGRKWEGAILRQANLRGANLSNVVLMGADLRQADLRDSILVNTFFTKGANLEQADLRGATMKGTFFTNANLRQADLRGVTLIDGSLERADLRGAKIDGLKMVKTFFCKTIMPDGTIRNDNCR